MGIDKFREHFAGHEDEHAIIGGAACDHWFNAAGLEFKDAKDIDMALPAYVFDAAFGDAYQNFVDAGGYETRLLLSAAGPARPVGSRRPALQREAISPADANSLGNPNGCVPDPSNSGL